MTDENEAPERIWVSTDLTAWCHDPMGIRETDIEYTRADLSDARIAELEGAQILNRNAIKRKAKRIAELEAKLARVIEIANLIAGRMIK